MDSLRTELEAERAVSNQLSNTLSVRFLGASFFFFGKSALIMSKSVFEMLEVEMSRSRSLQQCLSESMKKAKEMEEKVKTLQVRERERTIAEQRETSNTESSLFSQPISLSKRALTRRTPNSRKSALSTTAL